MHFDLTIMEVFIKKEIGSSEYHVNYYLVQKTADAFEAQRVTKHTELLLVSVLPALQRVLHWWRAFHSFCS